MNGTVIEKIGQRITNGVDSGASGGDSIEKFPETIGADSDVGDYIGQVYGEGFTASFLSLFKARIAHYSMSANDFVLGILFKSPEETMQIETTYQLTFRAWNQLQIAVNILLELFFGLVVGRQSMLDTLPN